MPIDPNIALSFKPSVALEDPLQQYGRAQQIQANAMAMRQARNENALAQQTAMAGQKTALEDQAVNKLIAQHFDPTTGRVNMKAVMQGAADLGLGSRLPGMQKEELETEGKVQNVEEKFLSNVKASMDNSKFLLQGVKTPEQAIQYIDQIYEDPNLKKYFSRMGVPQEQARAQIEAVANDPPAFAVLLQKMQLGLEGSQKAIEAQANRTTQLEVQGMIGQRMDANRSARPAAPARAATGGGGARPATNAPAAAGRPGKPGKAPPDPTVVAAAQDEKIGRIRGALKEADALIGPTTTGVIGEVASRVGGTKARDLSGKLETIKANLGFDELQKMRDASPTGGALGQVAVKELIALQATVASLDQGLSPTELKKSIKKIEQHYNAWYEAVLKARSGAQPAAAASPNAKLYDEADAILNRGRK